MVREFRLDIRRYASPWHRLWLTPAIWAIAWYRFGHWLYKEPHLKVFNILKLPYRLGYVFMEAFMQMALDPSAEIGAGLYLGHSGGIHIHPEVVIGEDCDIAHHVTIGASAGGRNGVPTIGNGAYIGTGATVVGRINIGDGAKIAANTLVMISVPAGATVIGVPGRVVMGCPQPTEGS